MIRSGLLRCVSSGVRSGDRDVRLVAWDLAACLTRIPAHAKALLVHDAAACDGGDSGGGGGGGGGNGSGGNDGSTSGDDAVACWVAAGGIPQPLLTIQRHPPRLHTVPKQSISHSLPQHKPHTEIGEEAEASHLIADIVIHILEPLEVLPRLLGILGADEAWDDEGGLAVARVTHLRVSRAVVDHHRRLGERRLHADGSGANENGREAGTSST